ncbi:hypothetical protein QQF64_008927 [Cirrhinus molitorella]|uniref:Ig-like domain-containing protein n=1 Tax=Cirrhinus molitorella TaxID=172907 RepID=A0ABR3M8Y9_9TELE
MQGEGTSKRNRRKKEKKEFLHFEILGVGLFHPTNLKVDKEGKLGNMMGPLLVHLLLQGALLYDALAWSVSMPKEIHGLQGSCLVIPCSFYYSSYPPKDPRRVVWYQWVSRGYPLVYDPWYPYDVIWKFRWQTSLYGDPSSWDCSLLITGLDRSHHGEKIYAWIDPENVGWRTYAFYDVTTTIRVDAHPQQPSIRIYGGKRMGDTITVECSTFHTCPYSKPAIALTGIEGTKQIKDESIKVGLWKTTLTGKGVVKAERLNIECSVTHYGGITVTAKMDKRAECVHQKIMIEPEMADVTVGIAKKFTCSVYHSCQKEPTITWNYKNMQVTTEEKTRSGLNWISYSSIAFLAANEDHEKNLTCTAKFSGEDIITSVVLHVQRIVDVKATPQQSSISINGGERTGETITVACSAFHTCPYSKSTITLNGIEGSDEIKDESVKNGLWKITLTRTGVVKTSKCVHHNILIEPEPSDVTEGVAQNLTCTVYHSCQKENPTITWNYENMQVSAWNKKHSDSDQFQIVYSNITFLGAKEDHGKRLICTGGTILLEEILKLMLFCMYKPSFQYVADVIPKITELPQSCVVIPCSFKAEDEYLTRLRVLWVNRKGGYMFHTDRVNVMDNFKGRTRVLGNPETWDMRHCQMPS